MAHRSQKIQFEIVAVLGLISLFTHMHIFWIAGLLLALIELPDFGTPLSRIAGSVEKIAGTPPGDSARGPHGTGPIVTEAHEVTGTPPKTYEVSQADKVATLPTTTRQPKRS
jgi:hypothetical protein